MYDFMLDQTDLHILRFEFPIVGRIEKEAANVVWVDVECDKVPVSGWVQKVRTRAFMVGLGYVVGNDFVVEVVTGELAKVLQYVQEMCSEGEATKVVYDASHKYDELVLEGRWTNVRRAPTRQAGDWPHVSGLAWENVRNASRRTVSYLRGPDIASADIPKLWRQKLEDVIVHNVRDIFYLALSDYRLPFVEVPARLLEGTVSEALVELQKARA